MVLAGTDDGGSALHYIYIAADGVLIILLVLMLIAAARRWVPAPVAEPERAGAEPPAGVGRPRR